MTNCASGILYFCRRRLLETASARVRSGLLSALLGGGLALVAAPAFAAQTVLGVELSRNQANDQFGTGKGVDIRLGPRMSVAMFEVTPELSAGLHDFSGVFNPTVLRALCGGRLTLDFGVRPTVFAHLGVGRLRYDELEASERDASTGLAGGLGGALDIVMLPWMNVGLSGSYNFVTTASEVGIFGWTQLGGHVAFVFDRS